MGRTILTVDDSASIRQMVCFTLKNAGYDVIESVDGADALKTLENNKVDMVITDLNMPNVNGLELIAAVRAKPEFKFTPIVFLTTESHAEKKQAAKSAGATAWIVKPFKPEQLLSVIKKVLG